MCRWRESGKAVTQWSIRRYPGMGCIYLYSMYIILYHYISLYYIVCLSQKFNLFIYTYLNVGICIYIYIVLKRRVPYV